MTTTDAEPLLTPADIYELAIRAAGSELATALESGDVDRATAWARFSAAELNAPGGGQHDRMAPTVAGRMGAGRRPRDGAATEPGGSPGPIGGSTRNTCTRKIWGPAETVCASV